MLLGYVEKETIPEEVLEDAKVIANAFSYVIEADATEVIKTSVNIRLLKAAMKNGTYPGILDKIEEQVLERMRIGGDEAKMAEFLGQCGILCATNSLEIALWSDITSKYLTLVVSKIGTPWEDAIRRAVERALKEKVEE